ncbi:MAG: FxsA family protein [Actinomycetes bacterium]
MALIVIALIAVPLVELWVIIQIGGLIGAWPTIGLLLASSLIGATLLKREGQAAWRRVNGAVAAGRVPARESVDGVLVVIGGSLMLAPGFITDLLGILLLIRPIRDLVRTLGLARLVGGGWRGVAFTAATKATGAATGSRSPRDPDARRSYDVEGFAVDADSPTLKR